LRSKALTAAAAANGGGSGDYNRTHITREPDALDAGTTDAFYQQPAQHADYNNSGTITIFLT